MNRHSAEISHANGICLIDAINFDVTKVSWMSWKHSNSFAWILQNKIKIANIHISTDLWMANAKICVLDWKLTQVIFHSAVQHTIFLWLLRPPFKPPIHLTLSAFFNMFFSLINWSIKRNPATRWNALIDRKRRIEILSYKKVLCSHRVFFLANIVWNYRSLWYKITTNISRIFGFIFWKYIIIAVKMLRWYGSITIGFNSLFWF